MRHFFARLPVPAPENKWKRTDKVKEPGTCFSDSRPGFVFEQYYFDRTDYLHAPQNRQGSGGKFLCYSPIHVITGFPSVSSSGVMPRP